MGQTSSASPTSSEGDFSHLQNRLAAHFSIIKSWATVSYEEVVSCIEELNTVTRTFTDRAGKQLRFIIKKGTDTTFLWKGTIRIRCLKINTSNNVIESSRLLTLGQFVVVYKEIIEQVSALSSPSCDEDPANQVPGEACSREELTASAFFPVSDLKEDDDCEDTVNECCVCMDRKACVMLSCCHEFCEICIDNWTRDERHSNCPLCRTYVAGNNDTWILTDIKDAHDYASEVKGYLVGLADRTSQSQM